MAPLGPPELVQPLLLGHGVAPPGRRPWPRVPPLASGSTPGLGCGVDLLGRRPNLGRRVAPLDRRP